MAPPKGNQFWKARSKHGPDRIFATPNDLWAACCEYFQWIEDNPLYAAETVKYKGFATLTDVPKMHAMTIAGLCIFLGVIPKTWASYRALEEYTDITDAVEAIIYQQKLSGAAADLLNQSIIARELGLKDKSERAITGADGGPIKTVAIDKDEYAKIRQQMIDEDDC